jgi:hypothetical protein
VLAQVPTQEGDLFHAGKVHFLGRGPTATQHACFGLAFVELTFACQRRGCRPRGKNPPGER